MKLTATVVWSVNVEVEVPDNATEDQKRDALVENAEKHLLNTKGPAIHECSDPSLID